MHPIHAEDAVCHIKISQPFQLRRNRGNAVIPSARHVPTGMDSGAFGRYGIVARASLPAPRPTT